MTHGSLFSGIGGFDLAAEWMGWENLFHCEWMPFPRQILKHYWPHAETFEDITKTDFTKYANKIDILTGGFPCQPYSSAGKRLGKEDERHLWPEMLRAIREIKPTYVVGENVRGLLNWNGGLVFDEVCADLENLGYQVAPCLIPACGVNAPHRRERIWFVAYSFDNRYSTERGKETKTGTIQTIDRKKMESGKFNGTSLSSITPDTERIGHTRLTETSGNDNAERNGRMDTDCGRNGNEIRSKVDGCSGIVTDTDASRLHEQYISSKPNESATRCRSSYERGDFSRFPTQSPVCFGDDGIPTNTHFTPISEERNNMDRNIVTKLCLEEGRLKVDFITGKIYSLKQRGKEGQKIELLGADCNGYIVHGIRYNGFKIQLKAHQIVWIAANGLYDKSEFMIDHINRDRKDNRLENLRLVNAKENRENATPYTGKLTDEQKDMMVWLHKEDGIPIRELAEDYGISKSRVHQIITEHSGLYGITFSKWRNESIKGAGNAIVPQVALQIFKAIEKIHNDTRNNSQPR